MPPVNLSSSLTIRDDGIPLVNASAQGVVCYVGSCSGGVAGQLYSYAGVDMARVVDELVDGPLVHQVVEHLVRSGGKTVYAYKGTTSTAGVAGSVTKSNGAAPTVSLTGTPIDAHEMIIEMLSGGARATATFRFSTDGGDSWSDEIVTAATYDLGTGVTANFAVGTYVDGDTYSWTDSAPQMTTTNVGNAFDALIASAIQVEGVHVIGQAADASGAVTMATLIGTKIDAAHAAHKHWWATMEMPAVDQDLLIAAFATFEYRWLAGCGGFCELIQQLGSAIQKRSSARVIIPRIARNPLSVQPMRDAADSDLDPVSGIASLVPEGSVAADGYHNEDSTPGFTAARIASLRTFTGRGGSYISHVPMFSASTSAIQTICDARVILAAATAYYAWSLTTLGKRLRRDRETGFILDQVADALDLAAEATLNTAIGEHVDGLMVRVRRDEDLSVDPTLRANVRLMKAGYVFEVETDIGFTNVLPAAA